MNEAYMLGLHGSWPTINVYTSKRSNRAAYGLENEPTTMAGKPSKKDVSAVEDEYLLFCS